MRTGLGQRARRAGDRPVGGDEKRLEHAVRLLPEDGHPVGVGPRDVGHVDEAGLDAAKATQGEGVRPIARSGRGRGCAPSPGRRRRRRRGHRRARPAGPRRAGRRARVRHASRGVVTGTDGPHDGALRAPAHRPDRPERVPGRRGQVGGGEPGAHRRVRGRCGQVQPVTRRRKGRELVPFGDSAGSAAGMLPSPSFPATEMSAPALRRTSRLSRAR